MADTFEEHLRVLKSVFKLLFESGRTVNVKKCKFARREVKFLGFKIPQDSLKTDDSKIEDVKGFFIPKNASQLASFLVLCSYYRAFTPKFSEIAVQLFAMRKKNQKFLLVQ